MNDKELVEIAIKTKTYAYAPYSGFKVGAAVLTKNGNTYTGTNIENVSYGATNCAERTAIFKAISEGERKIDSIAIVSDKEDFIFPCGICRQVIAEFSDETTRIICSNIKGDLKIFSVEELIPNVFKNEENK